MLTRLKLVCAALFWGGTFVAGHVVGTVLRPGPLSPGSYCLGNPNLQITLPPAATIPSSLAVTMTRGTAPFSGAVLRRYAIDAPGFGGTAVLRLPYDAEDLNGNDEAKLHLWHDVNGAWTLVGASARGVDDLRKHYVESGSVTGFSDWALADGGAPAAVTVLDLGAEVAAGRVRLHWQTASEIDCAIFDISDGGACLLLPKGVEVADTFLLTVDPTGVSYACRVAWRAGHRVGVSMCRPDPAQGCG